MDCRTNAPLPTLTRTLTLTLTLLSPKVTLWYAVLSLSPFLSLSLLASRGWVGCAGFALSSVDTLRAGARLRKT